MASLLRSVDSVVRGLLDIVAWGNKSSSATAPSTTARENGAAADHLLILGVPLPDAHRVLLEKYVRSIAYYPDKKAVPDEAYQKATAIYGDPATLENWTQVPNLKFVQLDSAGADAPLRKLMWKEKRAENVVMATIAGVHMAPISQHFIMTTLALFHRLQEQIVISQVEKRWGTQQEIGGGRMFIQEMRGKTVGVLGYGHIGRECARLSAAFGAKILAATSDGKRKPQTGYIEEGTGDPDGSVPVAWHATEDELSFRTFLSKSDVLLLALPSTSATRHILSSTTLAYLPSHAVVVNVGRGDAVDGDALLKALDDKKLAGAALDVTEQEPLPVGHPLFGRRDVLLTPHLSGRTIMYFERSIQICAENLKRLQKGEEVWNRVDFQRGY